MKRVVLLGLAVAALTGCQSPATRIAQNPGALANVDPATEAQIRRGEIAVGFTPEMVRLAMGAPLRIDAARDSGGGETWLYRDRPRNPNDFVRAGYRRRVEFDPVRRSNVIITEPVDDRAFPQLRTHSIYVDFREGRVAAIRSVEDL
jgi:hypothetical protein